MRANENTALIGERVALIPYRHEHVARYHEWMARPDLLEATASEPLTLEEDYEMQRKWQEDDDKLTFIVVALPSDMNRNGLRGSRSGHGSQSLPSTEQLRGFRMIGDVNLFLPDGPAGDVECEVMIAEDDFRGKGIAQEALSILLNYATTHLTPTPINPSSFLVRISTFNTASINLFDKLGFTKIKVVKAFEEVEMRFGRGRGPGGETDEEGGAGSGAETQDQHDSLDTEDDGFEVQSPDQLQALVKDRWRCIGRVIPYDGKGEMTEKEASPARLNLLLALLANIWAIVSCIPLSVLGLRRNPLNVDGKHCYITGGSSGLGLALAEKLAARGAHVTIVARDVAKLEAAVERIKLSRLHPFQRVSHISADLTFAKSSASALATACSSFGGAAPDHVYLCAGAAKPGFFLEASEEDLTSGLDGVYWVSAWTAQAAAKLMTKQGKTGAKIVFVSSFLGMTSLVGWGSYSPGKYALRGLADTLRSEFILYGIDVHLYVPAGILSPALEVENSTKPGITKKVEEGDKPLLPETCAGLLIDGLEKGYYQITNDLVSDIIRVASRGSAPWNNVVYDFILSGIALVGVPIWRWTIDRTVRNHRDVHRCRGARWLDDAPDDPVQGARKVGKR